MSSQLGPDSYINSRRAWAIALQFFYDNDEIQDFDIFDFYHKKVLTFENTNHEKPQHTNILYYMREKWICKDHGGKK